MGNSKKKELPVNLDFTDLDGGTVQKESEETILPAPLPDEEVEHEMKEETKEKPSTSTGFEGEDIYLPILMENGSYETKDIEDVTGEEFIRWIKNAWPLPQDWDPEPVKFDGPDKLNKRIKFFWNIVDRHESVQEISYRLGTLDPTRKPKRIKDILN